MRTLVLASVLAGCVPSSSGGPFDDGEPFPSGPGYCSDDISCSGGTTCTRTHQCLPPDQIFVIHALWTVAGQPPDANSCAAWTDLTITFKVPDEHLRLPYAPVPCLEGKFTLDRMSREFDTVTLGQGSNLAQAKIDDSGVATLDL